MHAHCIMNFVTIFFVISTFYQSICKIFPTFFPGFNSCVRILDNIFNCLAKVQYKLERQFYIINETNAATQTYNPAMVIFPSIQTEFVGRGRRSGRCYCMIELLPLNYPFAQYKKESIQKQLTKVVGCRMREVIYRKRKKDKSEGPSFSAHYFNNNDYLASRREARCFVNHTYILSQFCNNK